MPPWTLDEYAETRIAQRISTVNGVAQVQVLGGQKYAMHAQIDPHALAARQIGINEVEAALKNWNVNTPTGTIAGLHKAFTLQASGQLMNAEQYKSMVVAYRKGAPVRLEELGKIVDGVEDQRTASWFYTPDGEQRAITLGIQRQPGTNTMAVADAIKAPAAAVPRRAAGQRPHGRALRPLRHDPRIVPRRPVHHAPDAGPRHHGHLRVPAERLGDGHSQPRAAVLDHRHVRRHVHARLQPRQPVDDGPDPLGRLRRRRRDRDAREHLPARRDGRRPADRVARRIARDRLHHRLDDAVAGRGVHPGAVHGRRARPPVPRILGQHLRRHPDFGRRLGDADADVVQPLPQEAVGARRGPVRTRDRARLRVAAARLRPHAAARAPPPARHHGGVCLRARRHGVPVRRSCRRASFPSRTPIRSRS